MSLIAMFDYFVIYDNDFIIYDTLLQLFAEKLSVREVLDACLEFVGETEYCVWLELLTQLGLAGALVRKRHGPAAESKAYCSYVQTLLERTALRLGSDPVPGECMAVLLMI